MEELVPFGSPGYFIFLGALLVSRGADFLSTWIATPSLALEGNPIAKKLGWKLGGAVNLALCVTFAFSPIIATIVSTTSLLVAGRNFQQAWLMRTLGEEAYRVWYLQRFLETPFLLYLFCLLAQSSVYALLGLLLMLFSVHGLPFAIGLGLVAYAITVVFYSLLSVWRVRRQLGKVME